MERIDSDGCVGACVGFSESAAVADELFDATVGTVQLLLTGRCESVDYLEVPEDFGPLM